MIDFSFVLLRWNYTI